MNFVLIIIFEYAIRIDLKKIYIIILLILLVIKEWKIEKKCEKGEIYIIFIKITFYYKIKKNNNKKS